MLLTECYVCENKEKKEYPVKQPGLVVFNVCVCGVHMLVCGVHMLVCVCLCVCVLVCVC